MIPTMLSHGEYVVNANSTMANGGLLDLINSGVTPKYASPMARGGKMSRASNNTSTSSNVEYNINVNVAGSNSSADSIAEAVMNKLKQKEATRGTRRNLG